MREKEDTRPKRICPHCRGRRTCGCNLCVQHGGTCETCNGFGHLLVFDPALPPEFEVEAKPAMPVRRPAKRPAMGGQLQPVVAWAARQRE